MFFLDLELQANILEIYNPQYLQYCKIIVEPSSYTRNITTKGKMRRLPQQ